MITPVYPYKLIALVDKRSSDLLKKAGYINVAAHSLQSVWYLSPFHELNLEPSIVINNDKHLRDLAFREGMRIGAIMEKQKFHDKIDKKIKELLDEN